MELSANSSKCFTANGKPNYDTRINNTPPLGWQKTYSCCILTPMPWARLHPTISPSLKRKRICYSFILSKLVYHLTMVTLQKHRYTNNPTTKNTFIIAHVAILMAREGIVGSHAYFQKFQISNNAGYLYENNWSNWSTYLLKYLHVMYNTYILLVLMQQKYLCCSCIDSYLFDIAFFSFRSLGFISIPKIVFDKYVKGTYLGQVHCTINER